MRNILFWTPKEGMWDRLLTVEYAGLGGLVRTGPHIH